MHFKMHFLIKKFAISFFFSFYCERIASGWGNFFVIRPVGLYQIKPLSNDLIVY